MTSSTERLKIIWDIRCSEKYNIEEDLEMEILANVFDGVDHQEIINEIL